MRSQNDYYDDENFVSNSSISLETPEIEKLRPRLALIGVGGGGGNAPRRPPS